MSTWVVYKHTNTQNQKSYIGITKCGVQRRWEQHLSQASNGGVTKFCKALRKYAKDVWSTELLEVDINDSATAKTFEMMYIEKYDTYRKGYNSTIGGDYPSFIGPRKYKDKVEWVHKDFGREFLNPAELNKKYKLHGGALIKVLTGEYTHYKGWQLYKKGEKIVEPFKEMCKTLYNIAGDSIVVTPNEFSIRFSVPRAQALKLFRGGSKQCRGWALSVENLIRDNHRIVEEYSKNGVLLREFTTARACAKVLQVNTKRVSGWLSTRNSFEYNGFIYKYKAQ